ncbi:MAG: T9SS type A sorting domain-containing protein [Candidatus Doudnabacteria bacterium]|nr:T9SS type A sorting domain-containing protein [Candidatus Doudnabacteria bacterium]
MKISTIGLFTKFLLLFIVFTEKTYSAELPVLPQIFMQTAYNPPVKGQKFKVNSTSGFQTALKNANPGDIIELEAGITYTGPFTLPNKTTGNGWIYIISSAYSGLPAPCSRVSPSDAVNMPKIVANQASGATILTVSKAHHYRFVGIEFAPIINNYLYNVVYIGNGESSAAAQPNNIVFDRCYIHGDSAKGSRRGVLMNGASIAVIDSYVSDCKEDGADSQALGSYNGTGPYKIVNNYLEGAGENVMFGGADPSIPNAVASDIEIRCNHFFKPLKWMKEAWDIKNLLEFKNAQRVLVEGNKFENCWPNAQNGFAFLITPRNQYNSAPWSVTQDITVRFNSFANIAQGVNILGHDAPNISEHTARILIQNNTFQVTNLGSNGDGRLFQMLSGATDVILDHNTGFCTNAYFVADGSPKFDNFVFRNNMVSHANYGFIGTGTAYANTTLAAYFNPNWTVTKNADIGGSATQYPDGNYFPKNNAAVGFVNYAAGDYRLSESSPYKAQGTDGKDLGADVDSIAIMSVYKGDVVTTSIEEENTTQTFGSIVLSPQPTNTETTLIFTTESRLDVSIKITNLLGIDAISSIQYQTQAGVNTLRLSTDLIANGVYVVSICSDKFIYSQKLIVAH